MSGVQSVERAVAILREVGRAPGGLVDIAARVELATSTTARLLSTLEDEGCLRRDSSGVYMIGPEVVAMAGPSAVVDITQVARRHMIQLAGVLGEAVALSVASGGATTTVAQIDSPKPVQAQDWTGTTVPLHAGCFGLVTLAKWDDDAIDAYLAQDLERFTERTVTDVADIRSRIAGIRAGEQIWTDGEYVEGLASVAAVVLDEIGQPVASLYAYGPSYRFPARDTTGKGSAAWIAERVTNQAAALSKDLGWVEPASKEGAA